MDNLINNYNSTQQKLTDKYAPLQCKTIPLRPHAPWYTSTLRQEKRVCKRSERVAARTMLEVDRQIVQEAKAKTQLKRVKTTQRRLQTTQPTSGGAVTANSSCCANCVKPPHPQQWGPDLPFFGHAGHADPLDGWRCCSQKRVMLRTIRVRQL